MKDKIINAIHRKLCDGFRTEFLTSKVFEQELAAHSEELTKTLNSLIKRYDHLLSTEDINEKSEIISYSKEAFLVNSLNHYPEKYSHYFEVKDLNRLKNSELYKSFSSEYDKLLNSSSGSVIFSLIEFIINKTQSLTNKDGGESSPYIIYLFWSFFHSQFPGYYSIENGNNKEFREQPEKILEKFKIHHMSNKYLRLLEKSELNIQDEPLKGFEQIIINVGERKDTSSHAGWVNSRFNVYTKDNYYSFSHSTKDAKEVDGPFINIFIVQHKYLIKLSITEREVERTQFIIQRDCEKVSLKNECELVISKHHGNETIILDSRKEALTLQQKFIEIREGQHKR